MFLQGEAECSPGPTRETESPSCCLVIVGRNFNPSPAGDRGTGSVSFHLCGPHKRRICSTKAKSLVPRYPGASLKASQSQKKDLTELNIQTEKSRFLLSGKHLLRRRKDFFLPIVKSLSLSMCLLLPLLHFQADFSLRRKNKKMCLQVFPVA